LRARIVATLLLGTLGCTPRSMLPDADAAFARGEFDEAAKVYRSVMNAGERSAPVMYNLGTALLAADSTAAAVEPIERAIAVGRAPELLFRAHFNVGLAHLKRGLAAGAPDAAAGAADAGAATSALDAALASYKRALLLAPTSLDAKWNYELALREKKGGGGGGGGGANDKSQAPDPAPGQTQSPAPRPSGGLGQQQAEELLNSAAREEQEVQGKRQQRNRAEMPPGGKDW